MNQNHGWSTDYARSLTKDQWTDELYSRFMEDLCAEIDSWAVREPVRLALEKHSLDSLDGYQHSNWKIYDVSISGEISSLYVNAYFWISSPSWNAVGVEPLLADDTENWFALTVEGVLQIDNEGRLSSRVTDVSLDPDSMGPDEEWYTEDFILATIE
jgi:hypothetical protein